MENQNYSATIEVSKSAGEVFKYVNDVSQWWAKSAEEALSGQQTVFEGQSTKLHDEFIIRSGDRHYSKQRLVEFIPDKRVVWLVTDCKINWLEKDKTEWLNTKMIFEIAAHPGKTVIRFTHDGLVPGLECYTNCEKGWDFLIKEKLFNFITNDKTN
jgi:hypothetical protein